MIHWDREGQAFVLRNKWDTACPLSMEVYCGEVAITAWPHLKKLLKGFLKAYPSCPESPLALAYLDEGAFGYLLKRGYRGFRDWGIVYEMRELSSMPPLDTTGTAVLLTPEGAGTYENLLDDDLGMALDDGRLVYVAVEEGKIVSLASTNTPLGDCSCIEVGVETHPAYQKRGYAALVLRLLGEELLKRGVVPQIRIHKDNTPSHKTGRKAGFVPVGTYYDWIGENNHGI